MRARICFGSPNHGQLWAKLKTLKKTTLEKESQAMSKRKTDNEQAGFSNPGKHPNSLPRGQRHSPCKRGVVNEGLTTPTVLELRLGRIQVG